MTLITVGVDIGGSHLSCGLVANDKKSIIPGSISSAHYDHTLDADDLLSAWTATIDKTISHIPKGGRLSGIGFAMPGPFEYAKGISKMEHKLLSLYDKHLPTELNKRLKHKAYLDMRFNNDATCFAIGEAFKGLGQDKVRILILTLGTGLGAAFIEDKLPIIDRADVSPNGSLWQLPYKDGLADDYFSTRWFVQTYERMTSASIGGVKDLVNKEAHIRDEIFSIFAENLCEFLTPYLRKFSAESIVVGGNISKALPYFKDKLNDNFMKAEIDIEIIPSVLLEQAAIIGSAQLFDPFYWPRISKALPKL